MTCHTFRSRPRSERQDDVTGCVFINSIRFVDMMQQTTNADNILFNGALHNVNRSLHFNANGDKRSSSFLTGILFSL